jgi:hypothetical protein
MIITVNAIARAKKSDSIPCFSAIAVARDTTTDECTDGIPPLQNALIRSIFQVCSFTAIHFINTVTKNVIAGTNNK